MATTYLIRTLGSILIIAPSSPSPSLPALLVNGTVALPNRLGSYVYAGSNVVPISTPQALYQVHGSPLATQPYILTAPNTIVGNVLQVGSVFLLIFDAPDSATQAALATGSIVTMTFGLPAGNMATGLVQVTSVLMGTTFQVLCTLVTTITVSTN